MKRILALLTILTALGANAQVSNLTAQLQSVFWSLPEKTQQAVTNTYTIYQRACRLSPSYAGVTTNLVGSEAGVTNAVVTTNNAPKTFLVFFTGLLADQKVARIVADRCRQTRVEVVQAVGQDVVNGWTD